MSLYESELTKQSIWFGLDIQLSHGHVCRSEKEEDIRYVADMVVAGSRKRGRPKTIWRDTINRDMERWGLQEEDADDRVRWRSLIELGLADRPPERTKAA